MATAAIVSRLFQRFFNLSEHIFGLTFAVLNLAGFVPGIFLIMRIFDFTTSEEYPRWQRWGVAVLYYGTLAGLFWLLIVLPWPSKK